eukprot:UN25006
MVVIGITGLFIIFEAVVQVDVPSVPLICVGYGFGASFVALFAQLGGGIYTKAADVGADLVGKIEQGLDEDDPRNPAVVADLVGDNVGDCAGRGADLFESIAAEIVSAMILGSMLAEESQVDVTGFICFPLVVHAFDLVVSSFGIWVVYMLPQSSFESREPMKILKIGYYSAQLAALGVFYLLCQSLLNPLNYEGAGNKFFGCGLLGMCCCFLSILITQYYTDYAYYPVNSIARSSTTGHATNIITGISVGMESTGMPVVVVCVALLGSYYLGDSTGLTHGGLFGTAVATMGMLSTAVYVLSMDFFGPIADNAGGIVEMAEEPERVRVITDLLDSVGDTTKAATKGYAVVSASLACFLLFRAFMDEVDKAYGYSESEEKFTVVDIAVPEVFISGFMGSMLV